jgi:phosphotriesterase-related protein
MSPRVLRTVLGDIARDRMGLTLPHEHILCDSSVWLQEPSDEEGRWMASQPLALENLWWLRQFPNSHPDIVVLSDRDLAVRELDAFRSAGGATVIDLTPRSLGRRPQDLADIARRTGLNIVAATGEYVAAAHPPGIRSASVEDIAAVLVAEIEEGIDGTSVRAGVIGEIGMSDPVSPDEVKVLRAAAQAQQQTGAAISVHTAAHAVDVDSALYAAQVLGDEGADLTRVVMGHLDTSLHRLDYHRRVADLGCRIEYDLFGHEFFESENDFQSYGDTGRVRAVASLVAQGYASQLLLSHDICYKIQLRRFGGYGYAHLPSNIVPRLRLVGVSDADIEQMVVANPRDVFPIPAPSDSAGDHD